MQPKKYIFNDYIQLMRLDKPIGTLLLLWPTLTALIIASNGKPSIKNIVIFSIGTLLMRSAGCIINDFADRKVDKYVERTKNRPLTANRISKKNALLLFMSLIFLSFLLVLQTNFATIILSFFAIFLASIYPFMKRYTYFPQLFLGAAFAWSIPMAFTASGSELNKVTYLFFIGNLLIITAYDTYYGLVDKKDDIKTGIKSLAIKLGNKARVLIFIMQCTALLCFTYMAFLLQLNFIFFIGLIIILCFYVQQFLSTKNHHPEKCFKAFLNNNKSNFILFLITILTYTI